MPTIYIRRVVYEETPIDDASVSDWIRIKEAADLHGSDINYIRHLIDYGQLTSAVFDPVAKEPRYVSRSEVLALPPYERKRRTLKEGDVRLNEVSRGRREKIKAEQARKR